MKKILTFWAVCAVLGFACGTANAQGTPGVYNKARAVCIASVRVGLEAYLQATDNAQIVDPKKIRESVEFWGALQNFETYPDISRRAAMHIAIQLKVKGFAEVSQKIARPEAITFMITECYKDQ